MFFSLLWRNTECCDRSLFIYLSVMCVNHIWVEDCAAKYILEKCFSINSKTNSNWKFEKKIGEGFTLKLIEWVCKLHFCYWFEHHKLIYRQQLLQPLLIDQLTLNKLPNSQPSGRSALCFCRFNKCFIDIFYLYIFCDTL